MKKFILEHAVYVVNGKVVTGKCHIADSTAISKKSKGKNK